MKRLFCLFLSVVMLFFCVSAVDFSAVAEDKYYTFVDEDGYVTEVPYPENIDFFEPVTTGSTFIKVCWSLHYYYNYTDGVEIRLYNNETKKYEHVKYLSAKTESYRLVNLKKDTAYKISIRAYATYNNTKIYSDSTVITARTSPAETSLTSVKYVSDGKIQLKWKKVSGVTGYIVKYSPASSVPNNSSTCTLAISGENNTTKTISGLAGQKYYVKVCTYKLANNYKYCSPYSTIKSVAVKKGVSVKSMLNAIKTDTSGRDEILDYTYKGVDIAKYSTTYDRVKAIYDWHSKHNTDYGWSCVGCNSNFNTCLAILFQNSNKTYDEFIKLAAGNVRNNDGSVVMHKWSVIYLAGKPYIFDPRLQGYTGNKTGTDYFGVASGSQRSKMYLFDYWYGTWYYSLNPYRYPEYIIASEAKPTVAIKSITPAKKGFKLTWNKPSGVKGYQILYTSKKNFSTYKSLVINDPTVTSKTISGLVSGKTYYVKIRAYKQFGNTKMYGPYSEVKTVKAK